MDEYPDFDETTVRVRSLAQAPGELQYRNSISDRFETGDRRHNKLVERLTRVEERLVSRGDIAKIVATEVESLTKKVDTLEQRFWTLIIAVLGGIVTLVLTHLAFK